MTETNADHLCISVLMIAQRFELFCTCTSVSCWFSTKPFHVAPVHLHTHVRSFHEYKITGRFVATFTEL